jgi:hypothetical protein
MTREQRITTSRRLGFVTMSSAFLMVLASPSMAAWQMVAAFVWYIVGLAITLTAYATDW